jgi:hypothetical protein
MVLNVTTSSREKDRLCLGKQDVEKICVRLIARKDGEYHKCDAS